MKYFYLIAFALQLIFSQFGLNYTNGKNLYNVDTINYTPNTSTTTTGTWHWLNPLPQGNNLQNVTCVNINSCFSVGNSGTILKTEDGGINWEIEASGTNLNLSSISCPTTLICYVVSGKDTNINNPVVLSTSDGGLHWSKIPVAVNYNLNTITCINALNCFAGSKNGNSLVTIDGWANWSQLDLSNIASIACPQPELCFAASANGSISFTNNNWTSWNTKSISGAQSFSSISCSDSNHCMAAADNYNGFGNIYGTSDGGISWVNLTPTSISSLYGISCNTPSFCVTTGYRGSLLVTQDAGTNWNILNFNNIASTINSVSCPTSQICLATGIGGSIFKTNDSGINWTHFPSPSNWLVKDIECPLATNCLTIGGDFLSTSNSGVSWVKSQFYNNNIMNGLHCFDALNCLAVGQFGEVDITNDGGNTWFRHFPAERITFYDLSCPTPNLCFGAGNDSNDGYTAGVMQTTDRGVTWQRLITNVNSELYGINCPTSLICYSVGYYSVIKTIDGGHTWNQLTVPVNSIYRGVTCITESNCYIVGDGVILFTSDGGYSWSTQYTNPYVGLRRITCANNNNCITVGNFGAILITADGGSNWIPQLSGTDNTLYNVKCINVSACLVVGDGGTILANFNPGATFSVNAGGPYTLTEGGNITLNGSGNVPNEDLFTYRWSFNSSIYPDLFGSHPIFTAKDGPANIQAILTVCNIYNNCSSANTSINITNVEPTLSNINLSQTSIRVGSSVMLSTSFTEPGTLDTHTANINWGDGITDTIDIAQGVRTISGSHTYTNPGSYNITLNLADKDAAAAIPVTQQVFVLAPTGQTVFLLDSTGKGLSGGSLRYYDGTWRSAGTTDANGSVSFTPVNGSATILNYEMTYNNGRQTKNSVPVVTNPVVFQTLPATVNLQTSQGIGLTGGMVRFFQLSWQNFGTSGASGAATNELLPGTYTFEMTYNNGRYSKNSIVLTGPTPAPVVFQTTATTISLANSSSVGLSGGSVRFLGLSWQNFGTTSQGGNVTAELLPGSYHFEMTYNNGRLTKNNITVPEAATFQYPFRTVNVQVRLENSQTVGLTRGTARFFQLSWQNFGTTGSDGNVTNELLPGTYSFEMTYNNGRQSKSGVTITDPVADPVLFKTIATTVRLQTSQGTGLPGGTVRFFQLSWQNFGTTGQDGNATNELLEGTYSFEMTYANGRQSKSSVAISVGSASVTFSTVAVTVKLTNTGGAGVAAGVVRYFQLSWQSFGTTGTGGETVKELLPGTYTFEVTYNGVRQTKAQDISSDPLVSFQIS